MLDTNHLHGTTAAAARLDRPAAELARWLAGCVVGLLVTAAVLVAWRRLAGALLTPLEPPRLLLVAALLAITAAGARLAWRRLPAALAATRTANLWSLLPSAAVVALAAALSLPNTETRGLVAFWSLLAAEECWAWWPAARRSLHGAGAKIAAVRTVRFDLPEAPSPHTAAVQRADEAPSTEVLQQLTRSRAADGTDQLVGWLRMEFSAGQRTGSVHVAFCPPFAKTPELAVAQLDGPQSRIKTAQLLPYGARLDLKLGAAAERPGSVLLHFSARLCGDDDH